MGRMTLFPLPLFVHVLDVKAKEAEKERESHSSTILYGNSQILTIYSWN